MDKRRLYLLVGVALAGIAVTLLYIQDQKKQEELRRILAERDKRKVVVAKVNVPKGTVLTAGVLGYTTVPSKKLEPGSTEYAEAVLGKVALTPFTKGQQILLSKITDVQQTLSFKLPPGKRAITISVDKISSVNGMVTPGDFVDIIGTFPYPFSSGGRKDAPAVATLFQQVRILAVDEITSKEEMLVQRSEGGTSSAFSFATITFALTEEEAKLLRFALDMGKIQLLLRSAADESKGPKEVITMEKAWEKIFSIKKMAPPVKQTVEIYKGTERSVVDLEDSK